jgi:hypothetical protein
MSNCCDAEINQYPYEEIGKNGIILKVANYCDACDQELCNECDWPLERCTCK